MIAHSVTVILGALVTAGWIVVPDTTIMAIGTVVAFVLATVGAVLARSKVKPWPPVEGFSPEIAAYIAEQVAAEMAAWKRGPA